MGERARGTMIAIAGLLAATAVAFVVTNTYLFHLLVMAVLWGILATGLNLVLGYAGLLSLAHGAFFGIGAYTSALLVTKAGWNFWATIPPAMAAAVFAGGVLGLLTLLGVGRTFQTTQVFAEKTVLENALIGRHLRVTTGMWAPQWQTRAFRLAEAAHRVRAGEILDLAGLGAHAGSSRGLNAVRLMSGAQH